MRESLSLLRLYHWRKSFWNGHYRFLMRQWGAHWILLDTIEDIRKKLYEAFGYTVEHTWSNEQQRNVSYITSSNKCAVQGCSKDGRKMFISSNTVCGPRIDQVYMCAEHKNLMTKGTSGFSMGCSISTSKEGDFKNDK